MGRSCEDPVLLCLLWFRLPLTAARDEGVHVVSCPQDHLDHDSLLPALAWGPWSIKGCMSSKKWVALHEHCMNPRKH